jgi:hypothetical protein
MSVKIIAGSVHLLKFSGRLQRRLKLREIVQVPDDGRVVLRFAAPAGPGAPGERPQLIGGGLDNIDTRVLAGSRAGAAISDRIGRAIGGTAGARNVP